MIPWILLILLLLVYSATLPVLMKRAGMSSPLAYIPIVNIIPFLKMMKRPWWWFFLFLVPGVNLIMLTIINVEMGISFNKRSMSDQWFFGLLPWWALPKLAFAEPQQKFVGPRDWTGKKKSTMREWGEAIIFAVVAASVIRTFAFEAFTIPTGSMENSMLVGDYLFVSKMTYGAKIPQTPFSVPFVHNHLPGSMTNSYTEWFSLPYYRLPGWGKVERFDPVVFNFPVNDTILVHPTLCGYDYHSYLRQDAIHFAGTVEKYLSNTAKYEGIARKNFITKKVCITCGNAPIEGIRYRPMDKKENFVKRCIGLPGDDFEIRDRQIFVDGKPLENPVDAMWKYQVVTSDVSQLRKVMEKNNINIHPGKGYFESFRNVDSLYQVSLTDKALKELEKISSIKKIVAVSDPPGSSGPFQIWPNSVEAPFNMWTHDNMGPFHIPAEGETIQLTPENIILYKRLIDVYENNEYQEKAGKIFINGQETTSYTFKHNYYWMMGDNRHSSLDCRFWGMVPEDHVVGKPVFTWFSKNQQDNHGNGKVRWSRMMHSVK
ncbi:MAG: S26 family signal peptidase [Flavobacteriales bacterium]|nr:S26 family signal peptidase [Flavobacteriales bacterium]